MCAAEREHALPCSPPMLLTTRRGRFATRSAIVGEIDEEVDAELVFDEIVAEPLKPVVH